MTMSGGGILPDKTWNLGFLTLCSVMFPLPTPASGDALATLQDTTQFLCSLGQSPTLSRRLHKTCATSTVLSIQAKATPYLLLFLKIQMINMYSS